MKLKILPYKPGSKSARSLARSLGVLRIISPSYQQKHREVVLNWGMSNPTQGLRHMDVINPPEAVYRASNKLYTLQTFERQGVAHPEYSTSSVGAHNWLTEGYRVMGRTLLNGHSGRGIVVMRPGDQVASAPLYTKYFKKQAEYRVHIFQGQVIDFSRKKRRHGVVEAPGHEPLIRNHANGWVFCRDGVTLPESVARESIKAVSVLGLDFGAVDIAQAENGSVCVFEVNTAPGLEGTTLSKYSHRVRQLFF